MPREKKPQNEIRKTHVSCVLTAEEKRAFERRCDNHGYTLSTALRRLILAELGRIGSKPLGGIQDSAG